MDIQNRKRELRWLLTGRANDAGFILLWKDSMGIKFSPMVIAAALSVVIFLTVFGWRANRTIETTNTGAFAGSGKVYSVQNQGGRGTILETNYIAPAGAARSASSGLPAQAPIPSAFGGATGPVRSPASNGAGQAGPNDFSNAESDVFGQLFGTYIELKNSGAYTEEKGASLANRVAEATVAQVAYTAVASSEIKTDPDTSRERVLAYRGELQTALAPLLLNSESELGIFNRYVQTGDKHNLAILGEAAGRYRKTVSLLSALTVPEDALDYHLAVANSLLRFAVTLDALIKNADDPMATLALLRTYNSAEDGVYTSFSSLASYEKRKIL